MYLSPRAWWGRVGVEWEMEQKKKSLKQRLVLKNTLARETLSEFLGTFIMIVSIS